MSTTYSTIVNFLNTCYSSDPLGVRSNLYRLLTHGKCAGSKKLLILAVDQGFEHGPQRSFYENPDAMDPTYHFDLAIKTGLSGYAAPYGWLEAAADQFLGQIPLILKLNSNNSLFPSPNQAITASVQDAVRLGCVGVGFTLYPGSEDNHNLIEEAKDIIAEARACGLFTILWSYPRGMMIPTKEGETAIDVVGYGAHMACLLGAHIVKVKIPSSHVAMPFNQKPYNNVSKEGLIDRLNHIADCCFKGKRLVIFSGGETKNDDELIQEIRGIRESMGAGSIIGRNCFQRSQDHAIKLLQTLTSIYQKD